LKKNTHADGVTNGVGLGVNVFVGKVCVGVGLRVGVVPSANIVIVKDCLYPNPIIKSSDSPVGDGPVGIGVLEGIPVEEGVGVSEIGKGPAGVGVAEG